jgi:hypothetical protein
MSEELLKAVRDLDAHRKYLDTVLNEYRNIVEAVAPSVELTDNNRRRVPVTLIGPSHRTHLNNAKEDALERYREATQGRPANDLPGIERLIRSLDDTPAKSKMTHLASVLETYSKITTGPTPKLIQEVRNALGI